MKHKKSISALLILAGLVLQLALFQNVSAEGFDFEGPSYGNGFVEDVGEFFSDVDDLLGEGEDATSFTQFTGGLEAPSTAGYAAGLTKATEAREFILNVTNFALGFLGLIAVLVVIYGGVRYVTAAGKEDQATVGKKAITYAVIGLLIILGSFAIVNTILQAPSGVEGTKGSAEGEEVTGGTVQIRFNVLAGRVKTMARDLITAYAFHFQAKADLVTAKELIDKAFARIDTCAAKGCGDNWDDGLASNFDRSKSEIDNAITHFKSIQVNIPKSSLDAVAIENALDNLITTLNNMWSKAYSAAIKQAELVGCGPGKGLENIESCDGQERGEEENRSVFKAFLKIADQKTLTKLFTTAQEAVHGNFASVINNNKRQLKEMYDQVRPVTNVADDEFGALVLLSDLQKQGLFGFEDLNNTDESLEKLKKAVENFKEATPIAASPPHSALGTTIHDLATLYNVLKDLVFVDARLGASVAEGNAPLIINFSSIGSLDPSGLTIEEDQIEWDLDGDSNFNETSDGNCTEAKKATVSCLYTTAGTYRARLRITPSGKTNPLTKEPYSKEIGIGIATIAIKVNPPQTKINLSVDNILDSGELWIIKYNSKNGFIEHNRGSVIVPLSKAQAGIKFNAILTEAKDGALTDQAGEGATVLWDFGDGSTVSSADPNNVNKVLLAASEDNLSPTHQFAKAGIYTVLIEVTDKSKIVDRKLFTLIVATLVPQMQISNFHPKVGEQVTFDGSNSVSENGQITDYEWIISPEPTPAIPADDKKKQKFSYIFTKPGTYKVSLKISDNISPQPIQSPQETLVIESQPPVAQFSYQIPDTTQPATLQLDGSKSYDPDGTAGQTLNYFWEISGQEISKVVGIKLIVPLTSKSDPAKLLVKFLEKGTYAVTLTVTDPNGKGPGVEQQSLPLEKELIIDNVLDIAWGKASNDTISAFIQENTVTGTFEAPVTLTLSSEKGLEYEVDFGDGQSGSGVINQSTHEATISHAYAEPGTFLVKASVFDAENNENTITKKIYIGSADTPVAVIELKINGLEYIDTGIPIKVNRKDIVTFDASKALNIDGTGRRLTYNWKLDGQPFNTKKDFTHTFKELKPTPYKVELQVTNSNNVSQKSINDASINIEVLGQPPTLSSIAVVPLSTSLETPVNVQVTALGAADEDGKIVSYRWWYFPSGTDGKDPANQLGLQITSSSSANLTIGTSGVSGQKVAYQFAVELTDNENNKTNSLDSGIAVPEFEVVNGPNDEPIAAFNVDRTSILAGESVEFTSSSSDPDGQIVKYLWDFEGNGFADDDVAEENRPNITHTFTSGASNGIKVRLKVVDDKGSEAISPIVTIYVDSPAVPPIAAFTTAIIDKTVQFTDTSSADAANGANLLEWVWDFDVNFDSNGDGKKDNDNDLGNVTTKNPSHEYPTYGIYRTKLIVKDSFGATASITNFVNVQAPLKPAAPVPQPPSAPEAAPEATPATPPAVTPTPALDARLITTPAASFTDGKIHLKGESGSVVLDFSTSQGAIKTYLIDKNIYFDSNGNGIKDDDEDYQATMPGQWTANFLKSYGAIRIRLTVVDKGGKKDFVDKDIVFDPAPVSSEQSTYLASVLGTDLSLLAALLVSGLLVSIAGFAILLKIRNAK